MESVEQSVKELNAEIEGYKRLILDAEAAMDSAEKDLEQVLDELL